jgi:hypothetical protein
MFAQVDGGVEVGCLFGLHCLFAFFLVDPITNNQHAVNNHCYLELTMEVQAMRVV